MHTLPDKTILVVGGSSGIGYALAKQLHHYGAHVITASRNVPLGLDVAHISLDVTQMTGDDLKGLPSVLHGVVYCPGTITLKPFNRLTREDFLRDYEVNVLGAAQVLQQSLPALKEAQGSSVVLFSTVAAQTGMEFHASISAAKAGLEGMAKALAAELAAHQVRVNVIAPSLTDTPLAKQLLGSDNKRQQAAKRHPLNAVGSPDDMAAVAMFLLTTGGRWITGQVIGVDGGLSHLRMF